MASQEEHKSLPEEDARVEKKKYGPGVCPRRTAVTMRAAVAWELKGSIEERAQGMGQTDAD